MSALLLLHPGEMGVSIGAALIASGHEVRWLADGRGQATTARADAAGLSPCSTIKEALDGASGVLSVCPPHAAEDVAQSVYAAGFGGLYLDGNAISPDTAERIAPLFGEQFVDGGIIGPPASRPGLTRLYLSGLRAAEVAAWFRAGNLGVHSIGQTAGAASALKMCYAAYTKGSSALLLAVRALAEARGVSDALLGEWAISQPGLAERSEGAARGTAPKAWRFVGEMEEIAETFGAEDLPEGFHRAAAELYQRMADLRSHTDVELPEVLDALNGRTGCPADLDP